MSISVRPELWERFPGMRILVVTGEGLNNKTQNPKVTSMLDRAQSSIAPESLDSQNILAWKQAYEIAQISMSKYPVSVRAMVKRIANGGRVPSINPLVDFYNSISLQNISPLGAMDLDQLAGKQELRFSIQDELFKGIGVENPEQVAAGEICYADELGITTRHLAWRQSERGCILPQTKRFVLIAEIVPGTREGLEDSLREQLIEGLSECFGIKGVVEVVSAE